VITVLLAYDLERLSPYKTPSLHVESCSFRGIVYRVSAGD
jgi:hypothetical protein